MNNQNCARKKVGIITFHAAHNYGSNLQAWALQRTISSMGLKVEIINFRTERQKDQYTPLTKRRGFKYILKNGYFLLNYKTRKAKYLRFERFIDTYLQKSSQEYASLEELSINPPRYDYYISGSDQIWNTAPNDADDAYFLPFVKTGKRIAYAPSFGQIGTIDNTEKISHYLQAYDMISVREENGQSLVKEMIGEEVTIMPDPTLLIDSREWEKMASERIIEGRYIFFYTLFATREMIEMVKMISRKMNLPVVISNISNQYEIFSGFRKVRDAGPEEFLSLIKYAEFVCVTSFHGTVFSILLHKEFFALNGLKDKRICTLLEKTQLTDRSVSMDEIENKLDKMSATDYAAADQRVDELRMQGIAFLKEALDIGG